MDEFRASLDTKLATAFERGNEDNVAKEIEGKEIEGEREIKSICSDHFQEFISSCREILEVQSEMTNMQDTLKLLRNDMNLVEGTLLEKAHEKTANLQALQNIDMTIQVSNRVLITLFIIFIFFFFNKCLALLTEYDHLLDLLRNKHYFESLKVIRRLKNQYCSSLRSSFQFVLLEISDVFVDLLLLLIIVLINYCHQFIVGL
jgi:hypothetical protein